MMPQLSLYILKGLTPGEHEVKIIELAKEFRARGKTVVLGGVNPTILPDEALQYSDCVVIGEAEGVWEKLLQKVIRNKATFRKYVQPVPVFCFEFRTYETG
jgi:radical SAM superfamily enzyme YgiQ (UPF0313 family)